MEYRIEQEEIYRVAEPVVSGLGFLIVEINSRTIQRRLHVNLVIYSSGGVTLDDCAKVYRPLISRIEMSFENRDVYLEVGSPGISRNIKCADEFAVFRGKGVRILTDDASEWIGGIIGDLHDDMLDIVKISETGDETVAESLPVKNIRKAKLDDTQDSGR